MTELRRIRLQCLIVDKVSHIMGNDNYNYYCNIHDLGDAYSVEIQKTTPLSFERLYEEAFPEEYFDGDMEEVSSSILLSILFLTNDNHRVL